MSGRDVDRELAFHVEMRIRELVAQGVPPDEARRQALQRFGDYGASRTACVEIDQQQERKAYMTELRHDFAYAIRMLRRAPGFSLVAIVTLALGIGANSAIFSVVHGVLVKSLPYRDVDRLYRVRTLYPDGTGYGLSAADFMSVRQDARVFDQVEAYASSAMTMNGADEAREVQAARVSDGLLTLMGLPVAMGHGFTRDDHQQGRGTLAILSEGFWQRQFGGQTSVLGQTVQLSGRSYTIVGVLAKGARLPVEADLFLPIEYDGTFSATTANGRRSEFLAVIAHARPGTDAAGVNADLKREGTTLETAFQQTNAGLTFDARTLTDTIVGDVRRPLFMLLGAVGFVLLVACANVANLLLARASSRQQEIAVRSALGAGRARLFRQLVTESVVLGLIGGAVGLAVAFAGTRALIAAQPADIPRLGEIGLSGAVVAFTFGLSLLTSLIFGVAPAITITRGAFTTALREGGRGGSSGRAGHRVRASLVVAEMALAVVLLAGAGLLVRSFIGMMHASQGFDSQRAMTFRVTLQGPNYAKADAILARVADVEARVRALPGVTSVGYTTVLPLSGNGAMLGFSVEGAPPPPANINAEIAVASVSPSYFRAIGAPLKRGRMLSDRDRAGTQAVALANESTVRHWFGGGDAVDKFVLVNGARVQIVGIVDDILQRDARQPPAAQLFVPYAQRTVRSVRFVIRSETDPLGHAASIRGILREIDPSVPVTAFRPLTDLVDASIAQPKFYTSLLALFSAIALALAATGIFGVMSYAVAQRSKEISIRMALGAQSGDVLRMILGRALVLAGAGAAIGLTASIGLGRVLQGQLFGVTPLDPLTLASAAIVLGLCATIASLLPARRAAALDAGGALRDS